MDNDGLEMRVGAWSKNKRREREGEEGQGERGRFGGRELLFCLQAEKELPDYKLKLVYDQELRSGNGEIVEIEES